MIGVKPQDLLSSTNSPTKCFFCIGDRDISIADKSTFVAGSVTLLGDSSVEDWKDSPVKEESTLTAAVGELIVLFFIGDPSGVVLSKSKVRFTDIVF